MKTGRTNIDQSDKHIKETIVNHERVKCTGRREKYKLDPCFHLCACCERIEYRCRYTYKYLRGISRGYFSQLARLECLTTTLEWRNYRSPPSGKIFGKQTKRLITITNNDNDVMYARTVMHDLRDTSVFLVVSASIEELIVYFLRVLSCTFTLSAIL